MKLSRPRWGWRGMGRPLQLLDFADVLAAPTDFPEWAADTVGWAATEVAGAPALPLPRRGALCPYMPAAIEHGTLRLWGSSMSAGSVDALVADVRHASDDFLATHSAATERARLHAADIVVFTELGEHEALVVDVRRAVKPGLLAIGLTCGEFYSRSDDRSARQASLRVAMSPWPCLAVRFSTPHDIIFLNSQPKLLEIYLAHGPGVAP